MNAKIALYYIIFALIATAANIVAQDCSVRLYNGAFSVAASIFIGTGVGLLVKYELDRRYIFRFYPKNKKAHQKTFLLYALIFATKTMRYLGGILGLAIGYCSKYHLDKRYVFTAQYD